MRITLLLGTLISTAALAGAPADSGFDAHGFKLAPHDADPRDLMATTRAGAFNGNDFFFGLGAEYANSPLVFDTGGTEFAQALSSLIATNLSAGYAPHERVRLEVGLPLYIASTSYGESQGFGLGDVRVGTTISLVRPTDGGVGVALLGNFDAPTGDPGAYLGGYGPAGGGALAFTLEADALTLSANLGAQGRGSTAVEERPAPTRGGSAATFGGGVGYLVNDGMGVNLEAWGELPLSGDVRTAIGIPAQAMASFRMATDSGGHFSVGLGTGITRGAGSSPIRAVIGGGFGKVGDSGPKDLDADGIVDKDDSCPDQPETANGYLDTDGCPDTLPHAMFIAEEDGKPVKAAVISATTPSGETVDASGSLKVEATDVGTPIEATAVLNGCIRGTATATTAESPETVSIPIEPVRDATIKYEVLNKKGEALKWAVAKYRTEEERCRPEKAKPFKTGRGEHIVGAGEHVVILSASGYSLHQERFVVEPGETYSVSVKLDSRRVTLKEGSATFNEPITFDGDALTETGAELVKELAANLLQKSFETVTVHVSSKSEGATLKQALIDNGVDEGKIKLSQDADDAPVVTYE